MPPFFMARNTLLAAGLALLAIAPRAAANALDGDSLTPEAYGITGCDRHEALGACLNRTGQRLTNREADRAGDKAKSLEKNALGRAELADQIATDRNALGGQLHQVGSQVSPAERVQRENQLLARPYQPQPPRDATGTARAIQESMRRLGLASHRDLWEKGPEVHRQLMEQAENEAKQSLELFRQAQLGQAAGQQFGALGQKAERNQAAMKSARGAGATIASAPGRGGLEGLPGSASQPVSASGTGKPDADSSLSSPAAGQVLAWQGQAGAAAGATRALAKGSRGPTIRELLRARLADANARGDKAESGRIGKELATAEKNGTAGAPAAGEASRALASLPAGSAPAGATPAFSLTSDDERAVRATIADFESALAGQGSASDEGDGRTLFQRVTASIRISVAAGRVQ